MKVTFEVNSRQELAELLAIENNTPPAAENQRLKHVAVIGPVHRFIEFWRQMNSGSGVVTGSRTQAHFQFLDTRYYHIGDWRRLKSLRLDGYIVVGLIDDMDYALDVATQRVF